MAINDPTDISGLIGWYHAGDSATITESSGEVSQWDDKSAEGNDLAQATAANQPNTSSINSKPSIFFDGDDVLAITGITPAYDVDGMTVVLVITPTTTLNNDDPLNLMNGGAIRWAVRQANGGIRYQTFWNTNPDITLQNDVMTQNEIAWGISRSSDSDSNTLTMDGTETTSTTSGWAATAWDEIGVGARPNNTLNWTGHVHEVIIYNRALSGEERDDIENYINQEWMGLPYETNEALPITAAKIQELGIVSETDTALALETPITPLGLVTETDTALAITAAKVQELGIVSEANSAFAVTAAKGQAIGLVSESDSALAITALKSAEIGIVSEANAALALTAAKAQAIGLVSEADSALAITAIKRALLGIVSESDTALPISIGGTAALGLVSEVDTALSITAAKIYELGIVSETNDALAISAGKAQTLGIVEETDTALAIAAIKRALLGLVTETDTALPLLIGLPDPSIFLKGSAGQTVTLLGNAGETALLRGNAGETASLKGSAS